VIGMTPATLAAIRSHLTLFGPPEPNPGTADPVVAAALAEVMLAGPAASPGNQTPPDLLAVRITAVVASGPGNARVTRSAILRASGRCCFADMRCWFGAAVWIEAPRC
jgi:hypothetical protein